MSIIVDKNTRLLVQGNSGSGKSHLLRRLLERSAADVQQIVIDPEGDFVTLSERYGHVAVEADDFSLSDISQLAGRIREHRASIVLSLEGLEAEGQMKCAAAFLSGTDVARQLHLHARTVVLPHPQTRLLTVSAPLPPHLLATFRFFGFEEDDPVAEPAEPGPPATAGRARRRSPRAPRA